MLALLLASLDQTPHSSATLISGVDEVRPGQVVPILLKITLDEGWHTYWMNPGDSGSPTQVRWKVNGKPVTGNLLYPAPKVISSEGITTYGYEGEVNLVTSLAPSKSLALGSTWKVEAEASWLVCKEECVMARKTMTLELPVGIRTEQVPVRAEVQRATEALPKSDKSAYTVYDLEGSFGLEGPATVSLKGCTFLPQQPGIVDHSAPQRFEGGRLILKKSPYLSKIPARINGLLLRPDGAPATTIFCVLKK